MARSMEQMQLLMALSLYIQSHENNPKSTVLVPATPEMLFGPDYKEDAYNNTLPIGDYSEHDYDYEYSSAADDEDDDDEHGNTNLLEDLEYEDGNVHVDDESDARHRLCTRQIQASTASASRSSSTSATCPSKSATKGGSSWQTQDRIVELEDHECQSSVDD